MQAPHTHQFACQHSLHIVVSLPGLGKLLLVNLLMLASARYLHRIKQTMTNSNLA